MPKSHGRFLKVLDFISQYSFLNFNTSCKSKDSVIGSSIPHCGGKKGAAYTARRRRSFTSETLIQYKGCYNISKMVLFYIIHN